MRHITDYGYSRRPNGRRVPSPSLIIAVLALLAAMGGSAYATGGSDKKTDKNIANNAAKTYFTSQIGSASVARATNATNSQNAAQLGGVPASGYTVRDCNAQAGAIKGWASVPDASASYSSTFVHTFGYNCSGGDVQARRFGVGLYEVRFVNSPVAAMVATVNGGPGSPTPPAGTGFVDSHNVSPGLFQVGTRAPNGTLTDGIGFVIITP
jgi:hypothetical protein